MSISNGNINNGSGSSGGGGLGIYNTYSAFPTTGANNMLYLAKDTNKMYYWNGTMYNPTPASSNWGEILGTLANQTDLQNVLKTKQNLISTPVKNNLVKTDELGQVSDSGISFNNLNPYNAPSNTQIPDSLSTYNLMVSLGNATKALLPVKLLFTTPQTLSGLPTQGGYTCVDNDRVLVTAQTDNLNVIYNVHAGAWTIATDSLTVNKLLAAWVPITAGTFVNQYVYLVNITPSTGNVAPTAVAWSTPIPNGAYVGSSDIILTGNSFSLSPTSVVANTYTINSTPLFTVDTKGRITWAANVNVTNLMKSNVRFTKNNGQINSGQIFYHKGKLWGHGLGFNTGNPNSQVVAYTPTLIQFNTSIAIPDFADFIYSFDEAIALTTDGRVFEWGVNIGSSVGQQIIFGAGVIIAKIFGTTASEKPPFTTYGAIDTNGKLYMWGQNGWGQLGNGSNLSAFTTQPITPVGLANIKIVDLSISGNWGMHVGAIDNTGQLYTWGYGGNVIGANPLGINVSGSPTSNVADRNTPQLITGMTNCKKLLCTGCFNGPGAIAHNITRVLKNDGTVWSSGVNFYGELADGTTTHRMVFVRESTNKTNIVDIFGGNNYLGLWTAIVDANGILYFSGRNNDSCFGDGSPNQSAHTSYTNTATLQSAGFQGKLNNNGTVTPKILSMGGLVIGYNSIIILDNTGKVWGAGRNGKGQLGNGTINTPQATWSNPILPIGSVVADINTIGIAINTATNSEVYAGLCFALTDGTLWACGLNGNGTLGNESFPTNLVRSVPVPVIGFQP